MNFFRKKFKVQNALSRFMRDVYYISKREELNLADKAALKIYLRAIKTIKQAGIIDMARCAMAFAGVSPLNYLTCHPSQR